jgi:hypothetical protein
MAKFLDTTGISYHLEQIIKNADVRLVLISPFLKINDRIKELLEDKDRLKIDIRVIYGKNELQPEENNWLKSKNSIRTSFCKNLHAKCYMNEKEALITSMNLYEFSQANNNEMGIYVIKEDDSELFNDIHKEANRLIRISPELKVTVENIPIEKESEQKQSNENPIAEKKTDFSKSNFKSTSALSKIIGVQSKELFELLEGKGWIKKDGKSWDLTQKGEQNGGQMKNGQYGKYVAWPEEIIKDLNK